MKKLVLQLYHPFSSNHNCFSDLALLSNLKYTKLPHAKFL